MANLHLVTGYNGQAHITAADHGILNAMSIGTDEYVFPKGERFKAEIINNNTIRIYDGSLLMNGRQINLDAGSYIDMTIANGTAGMTRHDIIIIRYRLDSIDGIERVQMLVQQGTPATSAVDPEPRYQDNIVDGATAHEMPLYRVVLNGLSIAKVEPLFQMLAPLADIHNGFRTTNMLINGDFFCNQRQARYAYYDATAKPMYTADMWRAYKMRVDVKKIGGVTLQGTTDDVGYFTQFIQLDKLKGIQYTISAMVDNQVCTFTVAPGASSKEKDFGKFKIAALTTSTWDNNLGDYNNKLKINIITVGKVTIDITYVDVFEGTVAYPHVPEDPATALARCRRYVQYNSFASPVFKTDHYGDYASYRIILPFENCMYSDPTVEYCEWQYLNAAETWVRGSNFTLYETAHPGCKQVGTGEGATMHSRSNCVHGIFGVSCEPTDS